MQNKFSYLLRSLLVLLTAGIVMTSCNKTFDAPPAFIEPNIKANTTIKELKAMYAVGGAPKRIDANVVIEGIVVADDQSGNFYKSIAVQDATGGITLRLDGTNLYTSYPVGRKIYISMKGLYIGDYNRLIQIGGGLDEEGELAPLASALFDAYIAKGSSGNVVTPKVVTVDKLHDSLQSMLIQLDNMEFIVTDTSKTYADAVAQGSRNLYVKPCSGNDVIVRTSGFAKFAGINVPNGNGTLLAIYTMFGTTKQLVIRDTNDVKFNGERCAPPPPSDDHLIISEYVEGSSNNKYIEIYNAGTTEADLSRYTLKLYTNGGASATSTQTLNSLPSGPITLAAGATLILKNSSAALTLPSGVISYASGAINFNGDDVVELEKDGVVVDVFGLKAIDPGTSWTIAGDANAAVDKTVRRKSSIKRGNINWATSAGTNATDSEWEVISTRDDVSNLGTR